MKLQELLQELLDEGFTKVFFFRTYGPKDDDGNRSLLDLLLEESGEEIARCLYWNEHDERLWKAHCWQSMRFTSLPSGAVELEVKELSCMLALGIETELALSNAGMPPEMNRRPF